MIILPTDNFISLNWAVGGILLSVCISRVCRFRKSVQNCKLEKDLIPFIQSKIESLDMQA
jgi:hypothetical protein